MDPAFPMAIGGPAGADATTSDPLVGTVVGSFRIVRLLGRGGMGAVYAAEHPVIGSRVAIKFLHESLSNNPDLVARFYDEARAVNLIGHENIVGIFDLSMLPPHRYFIVMEYLDGPTLAQALRSGPLPAHEARDVLLQLCDALQCAHEKGVVHRDLKPDNVFLLQRRGRDAFVKLVDFGIAKLRDTREGSHTAPGILVGTPEYMAPEQCEDRPVDARSDVYALGVMAYQLFTGMLPHGGSSVPQILLAHLKEPPRPLRSIDPSIPPMVEEAVLRAMAKRPEDRFPDMAGFARALREAPLGGVGPVAAVASASPAATPAATPAVAAAGRWPVAVRAAGDAQERLGTATRLTRAGLYVEAPPPYPAPFARVELSIARDGGTPLKVAGDVVRVVAPTESAASGLPPGFAVQLHVAAPEDRAALARLAGADAGVPPAAPASAASAERWLEDLHARASGGHYEVLGLPLDADMRDVQSRARSLRVELESMRQRSLSPRHAALVAPLLERVALAGAVLGVVSERLAHDARRGNHLGVARCVATGMPEAAVAQRRAEFLRERPGAAARAQPCVSRAKVARAVGNLAFALAQYEEALGVDPLDLDLHREYWQLRREVEGGRR